MNNQETTKIGCKNGHKVIHIATMNVDTLRTADSIDSLITNLQTNNIDIACIQETHNNRNDRIERESYTIFFSDEELGKTKLQQNKSIKAGVAIAIKTQLINNITRIKRYSSRSIEIQIKTLKNTPNINIINTYAPDMSYDEDTHNKHWAETRDIMESVPKKNAI